MDSKTTTKVCNEISKICNMLAKVEKDKKQKEVFLKKAKLFKELGKIKIGRTNDKN